MIPETAILANKNVDIPPRTGTGMEVNTAPNLPKIPYRSIQIPHAYPAILEAHFVSEMIPMF